MATTRRWSRNKYRSGDTAQADSNRGDIARSKLVVVIKATQGSTSATGDGTDRTLIGTDRWTRGNTPC
jgi:hypothetical protein